MKNNKNTLSITLLLIGFLNVIFAFLIFSKPSVNKGLYWAILSIGILMIVYGLFLLPLRKKLKK